MDISSVMDACLKDVGPIVLVIKVLPFTRTNMYNTTRQNSFNVMGLSNAFKDNMVAQQLAWVLTFSL